MRGRTGEGKRGRKEGREEGGGRKGGGERISCSGLQLSLIRTQDLPQRQAALDEKVKIIADIQKSVDKEMEAQTQLQRELDHIRSLEPKVRRWWWCVEGSQPQREVRQAVQYLL